MESSKKRGGVWAGVAGGAGALMLACLACCLPLALPLLAWLSVAGIALLGPVGVALAGTFLIAAIVTRIIIRRRRSQCPCRKSGALPACKDDAARGNS